jgi:hypothetical protein
MYNKQCGNHKSVTEHENSKDEEADHFYISDVEWREIHISQIDRLYRDQAPKHCLKCKIHSLSVEPKKRASETS